jgi:hypothetical protein
MRSLWQVDQVQSLDDEIDQLVFAYETPIEIAHDACATRVLGLGVTRSVDAEIQIAFRQEEWHFALRSCKGIALEEFRPIIGATSLQGLAAAVELLRATMPKLGGAPERVQFQSRELEALFREVSPAELVTIESRHDGLVAASFSVKELLPELLGVRIRRAADDTMDVQVYRGNGADPAF